MPKRQVPGRSAGAALILVLALAGPAFPSSPAGAAGPAASGQSNEWTFRVVADPAVVRLRPDPEAPAVDSFAKGALVKSYSPEGAWIRFIISRRDGSVVIGYAASTDLELVETRELGPAGFWVVEEDAYHGRGINFRLTGGYGMIGGGDLIAGSKARFQEAVEWFQARDYVTMENPPVVFSSRSGFGVELTYNLTPRFGLGLGGTVAWSRTFPESTFDKGYQTRFGSADAELNLRTIDYRAVAFYLIPLNKLLSVRIYGGPLLAHVRYWYHGMTTGFEQQMNFVQQTTAQGLGAHAGAALELNINEMVSLYVEAAGRAGKVSGFEGLQSNEVTTGNSSETEALNGTLYAVDVGGKTLLMVLADPGLAPGPCREAVFDLLGLDARFGFKLRF